MNLRHLRFTRFHAVSLLQVLAALVCLAMPAAAEFSPNISMHEKAVFAFFKMSRGQPFFDQWIKGSDPYIKAPPLLQQETYERELLRLKWGFGVYDQEVDFLTINTQVYLQISNGEEGPLLNFKFLNSKQQEIPFFPYQYGREWIALIVNDLHLFTSVPLDAAQYKKISTMFEVGKVYKGELRMRARPIAADSEKPLEAPDGTYWLLMGDTAYIEFLYTPPNTTEAVKLWQYAAPWYLTDNQALLLDLLDNDKQ